VGYNRSANQIEMRMKKALLLPFWIVLVVLALGSYALKAS